MSLAGALLVGLAQLSDAEPTPARALLSRTIERERVQELLDDGTHWRFGTEKNGPVHVWRPSHYKAATAKTVVYVHGFYTDADAAFLEHGLAAQFRDSGLNALFIVPQARSWRTDPIFWPELDVLLAVVQARVGEPKPAGAVVVMGHSGAYKTVAGWLGHPRLERVLLIDGFYGDEAAFTRWLDGADRSFRQLVLVGFETQQRADWLVKRRAPTSRLDALPYLYDEVPAGLKKAPLVGIKSERFDHMALVTSGRVLPWLLRWAR